MMKRYFTTMCCCLILAVMNGNSQVQVSMFTAADPAEASTRGSIKGVITSNDGQAAVNVNAVILETNVTISSNEKGQFNFENLRPGKYTIQITYVGLQSQQKNVLVEAGKETMIEFVLAINAKTLETVVVRATKGLNTIPVSIGKSGINPMDLPQSIAVIPQRLLTDQQAQRLSDVIRNVNGVYLANTRAGTQENFAARGYTFGNNNLFKNGSRVNTGAMPEMSSLEKVEILKGSSAILFGNVAPGGIINMVTKKPKFSNGGEVSVRTGSYGLFKPSFDVYGPLSGTVAYRVNGTYETADSYRDVVNSDRYYINPSVLVNLGNRTELLVQADYLYHRFTPDFGIGTLNNTIIPDVPGSRFMGTDWQYAKTQQATGSVNLTHRFNESWKLNFNSSYQNFKRDYYSAERIQADANGNWVRPLGRQNVEEDYFMSQLDLTGNFKIGNIAHTLLAGIDADRYYTTNYTFNQPATYDTINILDPAKYTRRTDIPAADKIKMVNTPVNRFGVYIQDLISLSEKLKFLAGIRLSYQNALGATTTDLITKTAVTGSGQNDKAFSPRLGLVYKPFTSTSLFASYANSFTVNSGTDVNGNALDPSIIDQVEAGIKNDFFKGKLSANVTVYRIINHNLAQTSPFAADGITQNNNTTIKVLTGQTTSDGVELDLAGHPVKGLDLLAGYSYNYIRYTKTPDAVGNFVEGERLVEVPLHTANGSIFYTFDKTAFKGLKLGATAFFTGNRYGGYNNRKGQSQNFNRLIFLDGFTTIDLMAGYSFNKISLQAKVSNLTNTFNYYVHDNYSINPIAPRQLVATVGYRF